MAERIRISAALAVSIMLAGPAIAEDPGADTVIATVNGSEITLGQAISLGETLPHDFQALEDGVLYKAIVDQLIQQELLTQTVKQETSRDKANLANNRLGYLSGVAMRSLVADKVSDDDIKAAYDEQMKDVAPVREYEAAHILVDTEEKAAELKKQLDEGADFGELARENSTDPGSAESGGDLGWFDPEVMVEPFAIAVASAEKGHVAGPVKTDFGWHLILVKDTREVKKPSLEEARAQIAGELERKIITEEIDRLTAAASIQRSDSELDPAILRKIDLID